MQYLGSRRKVAAFSAGTAAGVFGFQFVLAESVAQVLEILPDAAVAGATMFAGTFVGILVWSSIGAWLKRRKEPKVPVCVGTGVLLAVGFSGAFTIVVQSYWGTLLGDPLGTLHDVAFWLAISLWNSIGYGLAVSPAVRTESTSASQESA